jgi:hypothetical protein
VGVAQPRASWGWPPASLTDAARHRVLESGDRIRGLHRALLTCDDVGRDEADEGNVSESLVAAAFHDAVDPYFAALGCEIGFPEYDTWRGTYRHAHGTIIAKTVGNNSDLTIKVSS